jgi:2-amino-4-hydroxy-6-hydroxymethyldihydropteridine diphosphokinase
MIYLGIGSNLPSEVFGPPVMNCRAAIMRLADVGLAASVQSPYYETAPVPVSDQPWYVNCVIGIAQSRLSPREALKACLAVEQGLGRVRSVPNAARTADIDLIAWHDQVIDEPPDLIVPHPRMTQRAFVLRPLHDIAPDWRHPVTGAAIADLIANLPPGQQIRPLSAG